MLETLVSTDWLGQSKTTYASLNRSQLTWDMAGSMNVKANWRLSGWGLIFSFPCQEGFICKQLAAAAGNTIILTQQWCVLLNQNSELKDTEELWWAEGKVIIQLGFFLLSALHTPLNPLLAYKYWLVHLLNLGKLPERPNTKGDKCSDNLGELTLVINTYSHYNQASRSITWWDIDFVSNYSSTTSSHTHTSMKQCFSALWKLLYYILSLCFIGMIS